MKKLTIYVLLFTALVSCSKSKEAIFDKCLTQANDTFGSQLETKAKFMEKCMDEKNLSLSCENECSLWGRGCEMFFLSACYE